MTAAPGGAARPIRAVAVVERDGRILLIRRRRGPLEYAVLPGGGVEPGETAEQAVLRELEEECGLAGTVDRLLLEAEHGGRRASYFHVVGTEGEPVLGGVEKFLHSERNSYEHVWVRPGDLAGVGFEPAGVRAELVRALWPIELRPARSGDDWVLVARLWQLHRHDLSAYSASWPDRRGLFRDERVAAYRDDPAAHGLVVLRAGKPVGFVLVRPEGEGHVLGELFLVHGVRRSGVGGLVVREVLKARPGQWQVAFQDANVAAAGFWRRTAAELLEPGWTEERRPVLGKPEVPADVWITGRTRR